MNEQQACSRYHSDQGAAPGSASRRRPPGRRLRLRLLALAAAAAALLLPAASASATPALTAPAANATLATSHPTFSWTLNPGQEYVGVRISRSSAVGFDGVLSSSALSYFPYGGQSLTSFTPPLNQGLVAGRYWWQLEVTDWDDPYLSPVQAFQIAPRTQLLSLTGSGTQRSGKITFRARMNVNAEYVTIRTELWKAGRRIGRPSTSRTYNGTTVGVTTQLSGSYRPLGFRFRRGEVYKVKMFITANRITRARTVRVRIR